MSRVVDWRLHMLSASALLMLAACTRQAPAPAAPAASGAAAGNVPAAVTEVAFGSAGPVSGPVAHIGKDMENGVRMALEEANAAGIAIGGQPVRFRLIAEDDAGDPKQATSVAQILCDRKAVAVVGHLQSSTSIPASTLYNKCGMPQITPSATSLELTRPGYRTVFRLIANDDQMGAAVAEFAARSGVRNVAIVDDRSAFGQGVAQVFRQVAEKSGMTVVAHEFTTSKAVDFMPILTSIKATKAEAILFGGFDSQAGPMLRQMQQLGMDKVRLYGGDGICTERLAEMASHAKTVENTVCATGGASVQKMPGGPEWLKRYEAQYPKQFQIYSPYAYDATRVLIQAMQDAGSIDPKVYLPRLSAMHFKGLTGDIRFTDKGELQQPSVTLYTYKNGRRVEM